MARSRSQHQACLSLAVLIAITTAVSAQPSCDLSLTLQPPGAKNVPWGWTADGQKALEKPNEDPSKMAVIKLAPFPAPVLHVLPVHSFLGPVSSCVANCLPPPAKGAGRRLAQAPLDDDAAAAAAAQALAAADAAASEATFSDVVPATVGTAPNVALPAAPNVAAAAPNVAAAAPNVAKNAAAAAPNVAKNVVPNARPAASAAADAPAPLPAKNAAVKNAPAPTSPAKAAPLPALLLPEAAPAAAPAPAPAPAPCAKATDPGTLLEPGSWTLAYSLDGGKAVELGPFEGSDAPAAIKLDKLGSMVKGEHYITLVATVRPESASVSGAGGLPAKPLTVTRKVTFELTDAADAMDPIGPSGGPTVPGGPAGADPADALAMKYYCVLNFNVGGAIKKNETVERVAEDGPLSPGAFQCARKCNKMGAQCAAFGVVAGTSCYLMSAVNASAGGADSLVTTVCMKNLADWMALGSNRGVAVARDKYYCLPTFDVQGWPAGQGPEADEFRAPGSKPPVTDYLENTEPIICAGQCSSTPGCEYFVQVKPAGCYLKTRPFDSDSRYGKTGPDPKIDVSCFRGEEAWKRAGSVLDAALPQVPVSFTGGGVLTAAVAAAGAGAAAGVAGGAGAVPAGNASALTYYCAREYGVNGTVLSTSTVGAGDIGTVACAAACDVAGPACAAHVTDAMGTCTLLKTYYLNTSAPDSMKYSLCFKTVKEWEAFGQPDKSGMYCLKKYDVAGDGITTRDFVTITAGAGAVEFCKGQCAQVPECEFVVTQLTKCYLKSNIAGGTYGKTGASPVTDATCVKGADTWLKFALQVSNQPAAGVPLPGGAGLGGAVVPLGQRRNASALGLNGAGGGRGGGGLRGALLAAAAALLLTLLVL